jgi:Tfp pilus assembly protein PilX
MRYIRHRPPLEHRQDGAALFMALIFLLILTILGVFGMNISRLENLMAGNSQFQTTALSNAEYVLARGEKDIIDITTSGVVPFAAWTDDDQYYTVGTTDITGTTPVETPKDLVWPFTAEKVSIPDMNGDGNDTDSDGTADDGTGEYVIENAGCDNTGGEGKTYEEETDPLHGAIVEVFLVSAKSASSRGAKRLVQSVVVTDPLPYETDPCLDGVAP